MLDYMNWLRKKGYEIVDLELNLYVRGKNQPA
jgi:hypothetical protein